MFTVIAVECGKKLTKCSNFYETHIFKKPVSEWSNKFCNRYVSFIHYCNAALAPQYKCHFITGSFHITSV